MILERLLHRIASCSLRRWRRHRGPKSPLRLHSTSDRNCSTSFHNKLNHLIGPWRVNMSHEIKLARSYHTVSSLSAPPRTQRHGALWAVVSRSVWHNILCGVRSPACSLEAQCHVMPRHVVPIQTTSRSLFAKRRHGPEDALWWRTAMKQMKTARDSIGPSDSGTWPHKL